MSPGIFKLGLPAFSGRQRHLHRLVLYLASLLPGSGSPVPEILGLYHRYGLRVHLGSAGICREDYVLLQPVGHGTSTGGSIEAPKRVEPRGTQLTGRSVERIFDADCLSHHRPRLPRRRYLPHPVADRDYGRGVQLPDQGPFLSAHLYSLRLHLAVAPSHRRRHGQHGIEQPRISRHRRPHHGGGASLSSLHPRPVHPHLHRLRHPGRAQSRTQARRRGRQQPRALTLLAAIQGLPGSSVPGDSVHIYPQHLPSHRARARMGRRADQESAVLHRP